MIARVAMALAATAPCAVAADSATSTVPALTPDAALKAAQAGLANGRAEGLPATGAVVDRSGVTLTLLRDRYAAPHTVDTAQAKARTAVNFKMSTAALDKEVQPGKASAGIRNLPGVAAVAGGMVIEGQGALVGAIGAAGGPGPANGDVCATAGIKAVADDLEF